MSDDGSEHSPRPVRRKIKNVMFVSSASDSDSDESVIAPSTRRKRMRVLSDDGASSSSSGSAVVARRKRALPALRDSDAESDSSGWATDRSDTDAAPIKATPNKTSGFSSDSSEGNSDKCSICLLRFKDQEVGTPETCEHLFCLDCITEWSKNVNTCPVDRMTFNSIVVRVCAGGRVLRTEPVKVVERRPSTDVLIVEDPTPCEVCGSTENEETMLLCDGCDLGFHMQCLTPPLTEVPPDQWLCPNCDDLLDGIHISELDDLFTGMADLDLPEGPRQVPLRQQRVVRRSGRTTRSVDEPSTSSGRTASVEAASSRARSSGSTRTTRRRTGGTQRRKYKRRRTRTVIIEYELQENGKKPVTKTVKKKLKKRKSRARPRTAARRSLVRASVRAKLADMRRDNRTELAQVSNASSGVQALSLSRQRAGIPSLSLFGTGHELDYFSDDEGVTSEGASVAVARAARPHGAVRQALRQARRKMCIPSPPRIQAAPDILSSILESQTLLHSKRSIVSISVDGQVDIRLHKSKRDKESASEKQDKKDDRVDVNKPARSELSRQTPMYGGGSGGGGRGWGGGYRGGRVPPAAPPHPYSPHAPHRAPPRGGPYDTHPQDSFGVDYGRPPPFMDEPDFDRRRERFPRGNGPPHRHSFGHPWRPPYNSGPERPYRHSFGADNPLDMRTAPSAAPSAVPSVAPIVPPGPPPPRHNFGPLPAPPMFQFGRLPEDKSEEDNEDLVIDTDKYDTHDDRYDPTDPTVDDDEEEAPTAVDTFPEPPSPEPDLPSDPPLTEPPLLPHPPLPEPPLLSEPPLLAPPPFLLQPSLLPESSLPSPPPFLIEAPLREPPLPPPSLSLLAGIDTSNMHVSANVLDKAVRQVLEEHRGLIESTTENKASDEDSDGDCPNFSIYSATSVHIAGTSMDEARNLEESTAAASAKTIADEKKNLEDMTLAVGAETITDDESSLEEMTLAASAETITDEEGKLEQITLAASAKTISDEEGKLEEITLAASAETITDEESSLEEMNLAASAETNKDEEGKLEEMTLAASAKTITDDDRELEEMTLAASAETITDEGSNPEEMTLAVSAETIADEENPEMSLAVSAGTTADETNNLEEMTLAAGAETITDEESNSEETTLAVSAETIADETNNLEEMTLAASAETITDAASNLEEMTLAASAEILTDAARNLEEKTLAASAKTIMDEARNLEEMTLAASAKTIMDGARNLEKSIVAASAKTIMDKARNLEKMTLAASAKIIMDEARNLEESTVAASAQTLMYEARNLEVMTFAANAKTSIDDARKLEEISLAASATTSMDEAVNREESTSVGSAKTSMDKARNPETTVAANAKTTIYEATAAASVRTKEAEYNERVSKRCPITSITRNRIKIKLNTPLLIKRVSLYDDDEEEGNQVVKEALFLPSSADEPETTPVKAADDVATADKEPEDKERIKTPEKIVKNVDETNDAVESKLNELAVTPPDPPEIAEEPETPKEPNTFDDIEEPVTPDLDERLTHEGDGDKDYDDHEKEALTAEDEKEFEVRPATPLENGDGEAELSDWEETSEKELVVVSQKDAEDALEKMTESISETEDERSYTPCLDENKFKEAFLEKDSEKGIEGLDTEMISEEEGNGIFSEEDRRFSPPPTPRVIMDPPSPMDDPKKKKRKETKKENKDIKDKKLKKKTEVSFKKLSKSGKERNYRERDREREKEKSKKERRSSEERKKRKEKRKDLERYDVRTVVSEKRKRVKDAFGRDVSPHKSGSNASRSPSLPPRRRPSASPRRKSVTPRRRSATPRRKSITPRRRSVSRRRSISPRKRTVSPRSMRRVSPPLMRRKSFTPRRKSISPRRKSVSPRRGDASRARKRRSTSRRKRRRSPSKSPKPKSKKKKRVRSQERAPRRESPRRKSPKPIRKRAKRTPSPTPPRLLTYQNDWSPASVDSRLLSPRTPPPGPSPTHMERLSRRLRRDLERHHRHAISGPSKEVFTSGDNILVSVSFKDQERDRESGDKRKKRDTKREKRRKRRRAAAAETETTKPVAIIDLERSPFRELTPSPKNVIVLSDSEHGDKESERVPPAQPEVVPEHAHVGPKTPPEPPAQPVKFNLPPKPAPAIRAPNPLRDEPVEEEEEEEPGPATPPESPDAYDPFEPTRSASNSPAAPAPASPPASPARPHITLETAQKTNLSADDVIDRRPISPIEKVMALLQSTRNVSPEPPPGDSQAPPAETTPVAAPAPAPQVPAPAAPPRIVLPEPRNTQPPKLFLAKPSPIKSNPVKPMQATKISRLPLPITVPRRSAEDSPYSPGSSDFGDLFEPPAGSNKKRDAFDNLFGDGKPRRKNRNSAAKVPVKFNRKKGKTSVGIKLDEDNLKILDDLPSSAVEMQVKSKFLKKLNRQERVVEEVKLVLKPHYNKKHVTKDEYKDILRKAVPKICHNKSGEINPTKIQALVEAYVKKFRKRHKLGLA